MGVVNPLFQMVDRMQSALDYHRDRHTVLAGNLANLDTPGYEAFDLARPEANPGAPAAPMAVTQAGHIANAEGAPRPGAPEVVRDVTVSEHRADGNGVSLERELAKIEANRLRYSATSELVARRLALLRYTSGGGT